MISEDNLDIAPEADAKISLKLILTVLSKLCLRWAFPQLRLIEEHKYLRLLVLTKLD